MFAKVGLECRVVGSVAQWEELPLQLTGASREELTTKFQRVLRQLCRLVLQSTGPSYHNREIVEAAGKHVTAVICCC